MKIRPVGAELFHADGKRDMKKLIVSFRNFWKGPNKGFSLIITFFMYSFILEVKAGNFKYLGDEDYS
jgi:hypothetical protein